MSGVRSGRSRSAAHRVPSSSRGRAPATGIVGWQARHGAGDRVHARQDGAQVLREGGLTIAPPMSTPPRSASQETSRARVLGGIEPVGKAAAGPSSRSPRHRRARRAAAPGHRVELSCLRRRATRAPRRPRAGRPAVSVAGCRPTLAALRNENAEGYAAEVARTAARARRGPPACQGPIARTQGRWILRELEIAERSARAPSTGHGRRAPGCPPPLRGCRERAGLDRPREVADPRSADEHRGVALELAALAQLQDRPLLKLHGLARVDAVIATKLSVVARRDVAVTIARTETLPARRRRSRRGSRARRVRSRSRSTGRSSCRK